MDEIKCDSGLVRVLREGATALPDDLNVLHRYLKLIGELLAEKAEDIEPTWSLACDAAAEVETLQRLEAEVAGKAVSIPARHVEAVLTKLAIWEILGPCGEECGTASIRDRLVVSLATDLRRIARGKVGAA